MLRPLLLLVLVAPLLSCSSPSSVDPTPGSGDAGGVDSGSEDTVDAEGAADAGDGKPYDAKDADAEGVEGATCQGHCSNGLQDCGETGEDCGGDCTSCQGPGHFGCTMVAYDPDADAAVPPALGYLERTIDPDSGHRVVRVTGEPGTPIPNTNATWAPVDRHHYSLDQPWNADQSLLWLSRTDGGEHDDLYLDGTTYEVLFARDLPGGGEHRWHPLIPTLQVFVRNDEVGTWDPTTDEVDVRMTFSGYTDLAFGPSKGNLSHDGSHLALQGHDPNGVCVAFVVDIDSETKYPDVVAPLGVCDSSEAYVGVSATGKYFVYHYRDGSDSTQVYRRDGSAVDPYWSSYGQPSHFDLTLDDTGNDIAVGVNKSDPHRWTIIGRSLEQGTISVLYPHPLSHVSARNVAFPGWVVASTREDIVAIRTDGSEEAYLLAHPHAVDDGYLSETHAVASPDLSRVLFASNWGVDGGPIGAYVVELCP